MHPFIANAQREAKSIFQSLDQRFNPHVYDVGLSLTDGNAYIGPSAGPFYSDYFANVLERAKELEQQDPEFGSYWGPDPEPGFTEEITRMQRNKERRIRCRAIWKALTEAASAIQDASDLVTECSWPVEYDGSEVSLILRLQKDVYQSHHHLTRASYLDGIREANLRENFAWLNRFTLSLLKQHPDKTQSTAMKRRSCGWSEEFLVEVITGTAV